MEDEKIVSLYWERNEDAIRETEIKYGKFCYAVAYNILHSREDSDECVNDTLNDAWNAIPPEKPTKLKYFLARITRNIAIDRYRYDSAAKRSAEVEMAIDEYWECIPSGDASIEDEYALKEAINSFLEGLDTQSRIIFMQRYWYGMRVKDIARGMHVSETLVSVILHRTRKKFKNHLIKKGILV